MGRRHVRGHTSASGAELQRVRGARWYGMLRFNLERSMTEFLDATEPTEQGCAICS
jgi:hypothetical protein